MPEWTLSPFFSLELVSVEPSYIFLVMVNRLLGTVGGDLFPPLFYSTAMIFPLDAIALTL